MTAVVEELERAAFGLGLTALELRGSRGVQADLVERAGLGDLRVRAEQWRDVAARLLDRNEAAARQHSSSGTASHCRSCGSPIWWGETETGNRMSMDPLARPGGNVIRVPRGKRMVLRVLGPGDLPVVGRPAYQSHFASCPHADELRRRRAAKKAAAGGHAATTSDGIPLKPCPVCKGGMRVDLPEIGFEFHPGCYPEEIC